MVEMICEIDPSYHKYMIWSKDRKKKILVRMAHQSGIRNIAWSSYFLQQIIQTPN